MIVTIFAKLNSGKMKQAADNLETPVGHITGNIHRMFLSILNKNLAHLDIERYYLPIMLIEDGEGSLTQQELAEKLSCDKVHVVRIIDYLSENGYVQRVQNSQDRRKYGLVITEKARNVLPDIQKAFQKTNALVLNNLSANQVDELYVMLKIIEKNLSSYKSRIV
jgi:MarR family transcriptional regulator for hemolysin